ncbi:hypothetical protein OHT61_06755 [Streptomyces sp. NBC_00178]|uniref:hypothetical protein n=1 Tax=Streptomyces sp. NBC_00178 TaxID=2975672 RepID=UPI002E2C7352|nr:hypothetical protein [Streptomyces sp. NBC_00178]
MRVLLPLHMYSVTYELAHGRPYSKLEELLLRAVSDLQGQAGCTYRDLRDVFKVHDRLLTEGLVTLIQEAWVVMVQEGREIRYLVTAEGQLTITHKRRPSKLRVRSNRASIVRERLTGQLARSGDLQLVTGRAVRTATDRRELHNVLRPRVQRTRVNGGETEWLLPPSGHQEWVRWIDSVARLNTDLYYLPVLADLEKSEVVGLPHHWRHLGPLILGEVAERTDDMTDDETFQTRLGGLMKKPLRGAGRHLPPRAGSYATASVTCDDLALTAAESRGLTNSVLAQALDNILVVTTRLDRGRAGRARDLLAGLKERGIHADLLWALDSPQDDSPAALANVLGAARGGRGNGKVQFNRTPSEAAMDLVLASTPAGPVAVLGSALLGDGARGDALSPAVRVTDPSVLAMLARLCAGWWEGLPSEEGSLPAHRWKHLAERWIGAAAVARTSPTEAAPDAAAPCPGPLCTGSVMLYLGPQQAAIREELTTRPGPRLLIADSASSRDELAAESATTGEVRPGFRVVGGSDGWQFMNRSTGMAWSTVDTSELVPPTGPCRVTAVTDRWLVEQVDRPVSALSFTVNGHVATRAWERTAEFRSTTPPNGESGRGPTAGEAH